MLWMDITMMIGLMIVNYNNNKKEVFDEIREQLYYQDFDSDNINEIKISILKNLDVIKEIKTLKVIELDNLKSFKSYVNYDNFLIFKFNEDFYFCDTSLVPSFGIQSMVKMIDFNIIFRKDKLKKINNENSTHR